MDKFKILTAEDLKALKKADGIVFYNNEIKCIKEEEKNDVFNCLRGEYIIKNVPSNYSDEYMKERVICTHYVGSLQCDEVLKTVLSHLKKDDEIRMNYYADANTNDLLAEHNLHGDRLSLKVKRKGKIKEYLISCRVAKNNSARMIYFKNKGE